MFLVSPATVIDMTKPDLANLGDAVVTQRRKLRLSREAAARMVPMSPITWKRVEEGRTVRELTYAGIAAVLGWDQSDIDALLAGNSRPTVKIVGRPKEDDDFVPTGDGPTGVSDDAVIARLEQIQQEIADLIRERRGGGPTT